MRDFLIHRRLGGFYGPRFAIMELGRRRQGGIVSKGRPESSTGPPQDG